MCENFVVRSAPEGDRPKVSVCLPKFLPFYSHHHPSVQRIKLCAVKTQLYNPCLPTLRKMETDTVCQKMPEEHSQTTTTCAQEDFDLQKDAYIVSPIRFRLHGIELTQKQLRKYYATQCEIRQNRQIWSNYLHCPRPKPSAASPSSTTSHKNTVVDLHSGSLGFPHERLASCFPRRSLSVGDKVGLDDFGQRLIVDEQLNVYRDVWKLNSDPLSHEPWRKYEDYIYPESKRKPRK